MRKSVAEGKVIKTQKNSGLLARVPLMASLSFRKCLFYQWVLFGGSGHDYRGLALYGALGSWCHGKTELQSEVSDPCSLGSANH